jgi:Dolichyl-phosphate-mannose-protein mannosyltransferase
VAVTSRVEGSPATASDVLLDSRGSARSEVRVEPRAARLKRALLSPWWLLAPVVAIPAVFLRVWHIDSLGVNSDEAVYAGQAASLAADPELSPFFPIFRAHPLLFQGMLSVVYQFGGVSTLAGRLLSAAFGLGTVVLLYFIGRLLYDRRVGFVAALIGSVMPYLVVVNRQILLDGPMTFFATLALYLMARFAQSLQPVWLYAASGVLGLTFLAKETSILLLGGVYAFLALTRTVTIRLRHIVIASAIYLAIILVYPVTVALSGAGSTGRNFLVWQLLRRANHSWLFYPSVVPVALGIPVVIAAIAGLWFLRKRSAWQEKLLIWWILGPVIFFEIWAVKGYQYLLPIAAPVAVLAARALCAIPRKVSIRRWRLPGTALFVAATTVTVSWLLLTSVVKIMPATAGTAFLAGTGGVPGGREAGQWIDANLPKDSQMLALGPSMANIIQFYGHRKTYALSVSPNPLHRNPVYEPVNNPDLAIRHNNLQYIVWDSFSAERSPFFSENLMKYTKRYHGEIVHSESVLVDTPAGKVEKPVIVIYQVRP